MKYDEMTRKWVVNGFIIIQFTSIYPIAGCA